MKFWCTFLLLCLGPSVFFSNRTRECGLHGQNNQTFLLQFVVKTLRVFLAKMGKNHLTNNFLCCLA